MAERARAKAVRRHERAVARRARLLARARRAVPRYTALGAMSGLLVLTIDSWTDFVFGPVAVTSGVLVVRAVSTLRHPPPLPVPAAALTAAPVPHPGSAAWPALLRLDRAREQALRLIALVGPMGRDAAGEAVQAAADADTSLRWQAARLAGVEPHRGADPVMLQALLDGVACQERLVAALADLVAASDPHVAPGGSRLQDAADRLHGLADGLRQLR